MNVNGTPRRDDPVSIFIPETIPSYNKGEESILRGMLKSFEVLGKYEVTLHSDYPGYDSTRYKPEVKVIGGIGSLPRLNLGRFARLTGFIPVVFKHILFLLLYKMVGGRALKIMKDEVWGAYCKADLIVLGHDGTFCRYHTLPILFSKALKKPIIIYGASFVKKMFPPLARYLLNKADLVTLRENLSYKLLTQSGAQFPNVHVAADLSFLMDFNSAVAFQNIKEKEKIGGGRPLVGITAAVGTVVFDNALVDSESFSDKYKKHNKILAAVVDFLIEEIKATVVFLPHVIGDGPLDDREVAKDIYDMVKNKEMVKLINTEYSAQNLKGFISNLDLFIGERTHSVISAASACTPFISLSFPRDYRTYGIIGGTLNQKKWLYDVRNMNSSTLISHIKDAWKEKENTKKELKKQAGKAYELAMTSGFLLKKTWDLINNNGSRSKRYR